MTRAQHRIFAVVIVLFGAGLAVGLSLYALKDNVSFFYAPSDLIGAAPKLSTPPQKPFRLGGLIKNGSITKEGLRISFTITDNVEEINVIYDGVPPDLFREGQGIIATGTLDSQNKLFTATRLLAKHDEKYMPPEVARALEKTTLEKTTIEKGYPE